MCVEVQNMPVFVVIGLYHDETSARHILVYIPALATHGIPCTGKVAIFVIVINSHADSHIVSGNPYQHTTYLYIEVTLTASIYELSEIHYIESSAQIRISVH